MGTIANKLQRVLDTKEDIRQAFIEEGKNVPADMPFRLYPEVIKNNKLPGLVGMYIGKGYTNEIMSQKPVWYDTSGNRNHIQFKNFTWKLDSGCGKYAYDFKTWDNYNTGVVKEPSKFSVIEKKDDSEDLVCPYSSFKSVIKITGLSENIKNGKAKTFCIHGNMGGTSSIEKDGVYNINVNYGNYGGSQIWLSVIKTDGYQTFDMPITIEQIPYHDGSICFDGVDDYGICRVFPTLAKEKGYTVMALRKWLTFPYVRSAALVSKMIGDESGAFLIEKYSSDLDVESAISYGSGSAIKIDNNVPIVYQTSNSYNGVTIWTGDKEDTDLLYIGASHAADVASFSDFANYALYALAIFDHDTTPEERQPVIDYWKKEYPELFPSQAWTVTGKTNSDVDRGIIKNITGNGNDLVLSGFSYSENSGYENTNYKGYLVLDGVKDFIQSNNFNLGRDWTMVGEWFMPNADTSPSAGIIKASSLFLYNRYNAMTVYINENIRANSVPVKSLKAICSDGRCYDGDWNEYVIPVGNIQGSGDALVVGKSVEGDNPVFTELALKNLAFYDTVMSKEQCMAAYNNLQMMV